MSTVCNYNLPQISSFLFKNYAIRSTAINETGFGLDNSVFIIRSNFDERFVLKIVESKSENHIRKAIELSKAIPKDFCKLGSGLI